MGVTGRCGVGKKDQGRKGRDLRKLCLGRGKIIVDKGLVSFYVRGNNSSDSLCDKLERNSDARRETDNRNN